jgi:hypothetical protein
MADDYGALVLIDPAPSCLSDARSVGKHLSVHVLEAAHGLGRGFALTAAGDGRDGW